MTSTSPNVRDLVEHDGPRVEEHDLDVEDDEDHRHQVEADREPLRRLHVGDDAALVGRQLGRRGLLARRQQRRGHQRERGEGEAEQPQNQDREVLVHGDRFYHATPRQAHPRAGQRPLRRAYDALVTPPDATPAGARAPPKKAGSAASPPGEKAAAKKPASPQEAPAEDAGGPHRRRRPTTPSSVEGPGWLAGHVTTSWWSAVRPGSSCAYWLAEAGWDVAVVEKKRVPPGEDLRRRADPPGRPPAGRHGPRGRPGRRAPLPAACAPSASATPSRWPGPSTPTSPPTATPSPAMTSTAWWPTTPRPPGRP